MILSVKIVICVTANWMSRFHPDRILWLNCPMSRLTAIELRQKLFREATRFRPYLAHDWIVLPEAMQPVAPELLFRNDAARKRVLELGAGWGEFAWEYIGRDLEIDYIAFEIKPERIHRLIRYIETMPGAHLRVVPINFKWFLEEILPACSFDLIIINFPDPWPKRRHRKHRLIQAGVGSRLAGLLRPGGILHLATDYAPYARRMLRVMRDTPELTSVFSDPDYRRLRPHDFPGTYFEARSIKAGTRPYYLRFRKNISAQSTK